MVKIATLDKEDLLIDTHATPVRLKGGDNLSPPFGWRRKGVSKGETAPKTTRVMYHLQMNTIADGWVTAWEGAEYNTFGEALEQLDEFLEEVLAIASNKLINN